MRIEPDHSDLVSRASGLAIPAGAKAAHGSNGAAAISRENDSRLSARV